MKLVICGKGTSIRTTYNSVDSSATINMYAVLFLRSVQVPEMDRYRNSWSEVLPRGFLLQQRLD